MNNIDIITYYSDKHPASEYEFDTLYSKLVEDVEIGRINHQKNGRYELFDYNTYGIYDHGWTKESLLSRGLVLDVVNKKIAAYCWPKFFNFGEVSYELPNGQFIATTKYDGSLGICYWDEERHIWKVNTRGSFNSDQAVWATDWLSNRQDITKNLIKGDTYLFEIIYPDNRIVISYDFSGLVLIGAYDKYGEEYKRYQLEYLSDISNLRLAELFEFKSIDEMVRKSKELSVNEEGWVITFENGYKIKIKGDEYVKYHKIVTNFSKLSMWKYYYDKLDFNFDQLKKDFPEEFWDDIELYTNQLEDDFNNNVRQIKKWVNFFSDFSNKEVGLFGQTNQNCPKWIYSFIFYMKNKDEELDSILKIKEFRQKIFNNFKTKLKEYSNELDNITV